MTKPRTVTLEFNPGQLTKNGYVNEIAMIQTAKEHRGEYVGSGTFIPTGIRDIKFLFKTAGDAFGFTQELSKRYRHLIIGLPTVAW